MRRLLEQGGRYVRNFAWLIRESLRVAPRQWRRIVIATVFSLGSNAAVVGAIYFYVRLLERNTTLDLAGFALVPRESVLLLGGFVAAVLAGLLVNAASNYVARTAALRMNRLYQQEGRREVLQLLRHLPDPRAAGISLLLEGTDLRRFFTEYPRSCGWTMRLIGNASSALALFVGTYGALIWLDPGTTLTVTLMGLAVIAAQYPAHLFAATASNVVDENRGAFAARLSALADTLDRAGSGTARDAVAERIDRFEESPQVVRYEEASENRFRALEVSILSMQTGGALVLVAVLFIIVSDLIAHSGDWAVLAVYATLLRQLLSSATSVFRAVTIFSRFSPHVQAYRSFVVSARRAAVEGAEPLPAPEQVTLAAREIGGAANVLVLEPGERFLLVARRAAGRRLALAVQRAALLARSPGLSDRQDAALADVAPGLPRIRFIAAEPGAATPDAATGGPAPPWLEPALEAALADGVDVLLVGLADFAALDPDSRAQWSSRLATCRLGLVTRSAPPDIDAGTPLIAVDRSNSLVWCRAPQGGLTAETRRAIQKHIDAGARRDRRASILDEEFG